MVKVVNRLQLSLELAQGINENLLIRGHIFVIFGTENTIINVVQFRDSDPSKCIQFYII